MMQRYDIVAGFRVALRALIKELRRLNHARMDPAAFAMVAPRDRARTVKTALAEHHRKPNRCC